MIGDVLSCCQTIEHDVKWIFASMMKGDLKENYKLIAPWTLGATLKELENMDNSDHKPFILKEDYQLLRKISVERNYIVHQAFRDFLYSALQYDGNDFKSVDNRISKFYKEIKKLSIDIEKLRLAALKKFRNLEV